MREADRRGMVVSVGVLMPRKDELLRDEAAVRRAYEETGAFLEEHGLRNVMVNLYQEFNHPTRIDHEQFREPDSHIGYQWLGLTRGQILTGGLLVAGVALLLVARRRPPQEFTPPPPPPADGSTAAR